MIAVLGHVIANHRPVECLLVAGADVGPYNMLRRDNCVHESVHTQSGRAIWVQGTIVCMSQYTHSLVEQSAYNYNTYTRLQSGYKEQVARRISNRVCVL